MIAIETGAIGHNMCIVSACATGTHNVGEAAEAHPPRRLHRGHHRLDRGAAARGRPRRLLEHARHGHAPARRGAADRLAAVRHDARRLRPRRGRGRAVPRGPRAAPRPAARSIYAEVVGYGSAADGWDMIQPIDAGVGVGPGDADGPRAARRAGRRGRPDQPARHVDAARRQARGGGDLDGVRARATRDAQSLAISGTKSMTGHLMGAAGAFEAFATVMSVAEQCAPGTINYRDSDPECDLWVVTETQADADPLRALEQHRPRRPQRRGHLQALRRRLISRRRAARPVGTTRRSRRSTS